MAQDDKQRDSAANTEPLPVDLVVPELLQAIRAHQRVVLEAPTGAGKTTRVPPALLEVASRQVIVLEPRRVAARAAATRIAQEQNWSLGHEVGYQIRFDRRATDATRVLFVTEGVLLRLLQDDPFLEHADCVVFDEFHERNLQSDTALALLQRLQAEVRDDLRLLVMSATLDAQRLADRLEANIVQSKGRTYPIDIQYLKREDQRPLADQVASAALRESRTAQDHSQGGEGCGVNGSILAFLPGIGEIRRARTMLEDNDCPLPIFELYGDLPLEQQHAVLRSDQCRVVLATNVAETSVTVAGITTVIDSGKHRQLRFDPRSGFDRLELLPVSKASANQRAGRAGRQAAGRALRLWTESEHSVRIDADAPEIERVDFSATYLYLRAQNEDPRSLPWLDPPAASVLDRAGHLLRQLGALEGDRLTEMGRAMATMPLHPRLARLLLAAADIGLAQDGAQLAALLSERDIINGEPHAKATTDSDLLDRLDAFNGQGPLRSRVHRGRAQRLQRIAQQLLRHLNQTRATAAIPLPAETNDRRRQLAGCLLQAFPDRIALFAPSGAPNSMGAHNHALDSRPSGRMVSGGGVVLSRYCRVHLAPDHAQLVLCLEFGGELRRDDRKTTNVHSATLIDQAQLDPNLMETQERATFDPKTERVTGSRVTVYGATSQQEGLILEEREAPVSDEQASRVLIAAALEQPKQALGLDQPSVESLLRRIAFVRLHDPNSDLPSFDSDFFGAELPALSQGARSFAALRKTVAQWLPSQLTYQQAQAVDRLAPKRITLPNGRTAKIDYSAVDPSDPSTRPVLAARIQDLFGWQDTPTVAGGKVQLRLHLLAPNQRPQQITDDLRGFWTGSYELVRKDLAGRYPKHAWPKDPLNAEPIRPKTRRRT